MSTLLDGVLPPTETSDMTLVASLRGILRSKDLASARTIFDASTFWYGPDLNERSLVVWSENHMAMNVSCDVLLREALGMDLSEDLLSRLRVCLDLKAQYGAAEFLSPVYLPFTIAALLNMYDFSGLPWVHTKCQMALDRIAEQLLAVTLSDGSSVSPSGRSYARHRLTTHTQLNLFSSYIINDCSLPPGVGTPDMALKLCLTSTSYHPASTVYRNLTETGSDVKIRLSPTWDELLDYLDANNVQDDVYATVLFSHGAYVPPRRAAQERVLRFMNAQNLWSHPHFRALSGLRGITRCMGAHRLAGVVLATTSCGPAKSFTRGSLLTGANLVVHREGSVILSSLEAYNPGLPCYQQWPWAINLAGVPVWCAFGSVGGGGISCLGNRSAALEMSTSRVIPVMKQESNRLTATYKAADPLLRLTNARIEPTFYWPEEQFDSFGTINEWQYARRGNAVVAYRIRDNTVEVVIRDLGVAGLSLFQFLSLLQGR